LTLLDKRLSPPTSHPFQLSILNIVPVTPRLLVLALAALITSCAGSCARSQPPRPPAPNIVLITIDTLRADRVGRGLTPTIDALAARGRRFTMARTTVPLTLPAHVSIMTGLLPLAHGVRENGVVFKPQRPTLAKSLAQAGFQTAAFVGAFVLDRRFGLADGFEHYDDRIARDPNAADRLEAERKGADVVDATLAWLAKARSPYFVWVHLYDPHAPYDPPNEYLSRAEENPYDGEIAYADAQVARIDSALAGNRGNTVIAVLGDHGEGLGDHAERTHGMLAYDSTLRVPLVLAGAGIETGVVDAPVSVIDLAPTLLRRAGLTPEVNASAIDLLSAIPRDRDVYAETRYPRTVGWHSLSVLAGERWKLVLSSSAELYDIAADAAEKLDVSAAHSPIVQGMTSRVRQMEASAGTFSAQVDPEAAERLRALGYVSGAASASGKDDPKAPNPARVVSAWSTFEEALGHLNMGHTSIAVPMLKDLASRFPSAATFQATYARALMEDGKARDAVRVYRDAIARSSPSASLFHDLAVAARAAGDAAEAMRAEQAALALDKESPSALNGLGLLHADAGRSKEAAGAFERAATLDQSNASYWTNLGNARRELGDVAGSETAYRRALQVDANYPDALNGLGVLLVQRGAASDAVPLLNRAVEESPNFHEARLNLGIAYQESGDRAKAAETYRQLVATPGAAARREREAASELLKTLR
jgi:arylsulfatase A-like enzyme/Flp pilus assembly protein TadD